MSTPRRSQREKRKPDRWLFMQSCNYRRTSFHEDVLMQKECIDATNSEWIDALNSEMDSLHDVDFGK